MTSLSPVHKLVVVRCPAAAAYHHFTAGLAQWWPLKAQSVFGDEAVGCAFEARAGGRIVEYAKDGGEALWGTVLIAEPARRLVFTWHPGRSPMTAQEVTVHFLGTEGGTRVELEHSQWETLGARADETRQSYDTGWDLVLGKCFGGHANAERR